MVFHWTLVLVLTIASRQVVAQSVSDVPQCAVRGTLLTLTVFNVAKKQEYRKKLRSQV